MFCNQALIEAAHPKQWEWPRQAPSPGPTLGSISASRSHKLWTLSVSICDLFCASVSKVCPEVIASSLYTFSAYESFHRNVLLRCSEGNQYFYLRTLKIFMSGLQRIMYKLHMILPSNTPFYAFFSLRISAKLSFRMHEFFLSAMESICCPIQSQGQLTESTRMEFHWKE